MLQTLHDKFSGIAAKILLGIVVIVFGGFFGIEQYMNPKSETFVAKVDGKEISQDQFREAYNRYRSQMQQAFGAQFDAAAFDTPERKHQVLEQLINDQLLANANAKLGVMVPVSQIREAIEAIPAFQTDGKFDADVYRMRLQAAGRTAESFQDDVIKDLATRQLPSDLAQSNVVTNAEIDSYLKLRDQTRDFSYIKLDKPAADAIKIADADIEKFYKDHAAEFMTPEKVSLDYVELDAAKMKADLVPDEAVLKQRYEDQKARFTTAEQRQASHILIKVAKNANADAQKAALEKAKAIEAEIKAGKDFAAVAKEKSDDLGSKSQGGDLGWLDKGLTDPAFETALWAMKKGDVSDPVLSPEGYHIIELRDVREGKVKSFEEVKAELTKQYLETENARRYSELAGKLVDTLGNDPSLTNVAKTFNLPLQKTTLFTRAGGEGIAANPAVLKAAFSPTVLVEGGTSDTITLAPNHVVFVHLDQHEKPAPKSLDQVREEIRGKLVTEQLAKQAKEQADTLYARLQKGETLDQIAAVAKAKVEQEKDIGRNAANLDGKLVGEVFKLARPAADKPTTAEVALANDAYALVALTSVKDADPSKLDAKSKEAARNQLAAGYSNDAVRGFLDALRKSADVKVAEERMLQ
ncbi:MAG: SurA N-terminal domain-containing protein [Rudaea sp.]|uniref:SurA N-terminal domain-containing protein n=1 Tax=unclassified Rudaea TaxID=2627037 RepID=UPI0010F9A79B|nr:MULTISPECIES: SurA N-terminal domain-containing protein [unclassified Rudaea]MBN8884652.1 SurA N-terminal domain-containing protein [Rudaea sp.]